MTEPSITYIQCDGSQCDLYAPDEGECRACMERKARELLQDGEQE